MTQEEQRKQSIAQLEQYLELGLSVFPVGHDKRPLGSWLKFQKERIETVEEFLSLSSEYNRKQKTVTGMAVVTGEISGLVVVDIDFKNGGTDICEGIETPTVRTPSGGLHYYFLYEEGVRNAAGIVKGVDIRAEGGYVVAPPSKIYDLDDKNNFINEREYTWVKSWEDCNFSVATLPDRIKELIKNQNPTDYKRFELGSFDIGSRNNSFASLIGSLLRKYTQEEWETIVWPMIRSMNAGLPEALPEDELRATFQSIVTTELRNHFYMDEKVVEKISENATEDEFKEIVKQLFDLEMIKGRRTGIAAVDRITGGIRKATSIVLIADTNMGKSILIQNIMVKMAKEQGAKSVIFDLENGLNQVWQRLVKIWYGLPTEYFYDKDHKNDVMDKVKEISQYIKVYTHNYLDEHLTNEGGEEQDMYKLILSLIDKHSQQGYEMFLVDPLQELENEVDSMRALQEQGKLIRYFKNQAQELKITTFICHHLRKTDKKARRVDEEEDLLEQKSEIIIPTADDAKGSGKIKDSTTDMWGFVRFRNSLDDVKRAQSRLEVLKTRSKFSGVSILWFDEITLRFVDDSHELSKSKANLFNNEVKNTVITTEEVLEELSKPLV